MTAPPVDAQRLSREQLDVLHGQANAVSGGWGALIAKAELRALLAAYEAMQAAPIACHRTITGNGSAWGWIDGPPTLGALDNLRVHSTWRIELARLVPSEAK
jgi:hypothetical protein